ncbi:hypothetical protein OsI_28761 [Oryza sativa Indica Group]|uniref:Uncharacterized protein n=1 Tax=Oryza sativa subsp. indica TaxID=39946 RepID=B8B9P6_ORYSI|nr:hypothetical protein OsI_28761 [Oryza sativa Indica Group]
MPPTQPRCAADAAVGGAADDTATESTAVSIHFLCRLTVVAIRHPPPSPSTIHYRPDRPSVRWRFASRIRLTAPNPHRSRRPAEP